MAKKKDSKEDEKKKLERPIGENRKARHDYEIIDTLECGIQLVGSEVKTLRDGKVSLGEAFARVLRGEVFLVNCEIPEYRNTSMFLNHVPKRPRKLLLRKSEIVKFAAKSEDKGLSIVPLKMYFKRGLVKVLLGIGRGRKQHDKRDKLKQQDAKRDIARVMRSRD